MSSLCKGKQCRIPRFESLNGVQRNTYFSIFSINKYKSLNSTLKLWELLYYCCVLICHLDKMLTKPLAVNYHCYRVCRLSDSLLWAKEIKETNLENDDNIADWTSYLRFIILQAQ